MLLTVIILPTISHYTTGMANLKRDQLSRVLLKDLLTSPWQGTKTVPKIRPHCSLTELLTASLNERDRKRGWRKYTTSSVRTVLQKRNTHAYQEQEAILAYRKCRGSEIDSAPCGHAHQHRYSRFPRAADSTMPLQDVSKYIIRLNQYKSICLEDLTSYIVSLPML